MLHNLKHFKSRYVAEYKMDEFFIANIIFGKKKKEIQRNSILSLVSDETSNQSSPSYTHSPSPNGYAAILCT